MAITAPTDISNLRAWYDATDASSITKDGSNRVSQWNDKSGNAYHLTQATDANKPVCTGLPVVNAASAALVFDGVNDFLRNASVTYSSVAVTLAICFIPDTIAGATDVECVVASKISGNNNGWGFAQSNSYNAPGTEYPYEASEYYNGATNVPGTGYVFGIASRQWYRFVQYNAYVVIVTFPAHTSVNGLNVGSFADPTYYGGFKVAEIAVYNKTLSGAEITDMATYMMTKHEFREAVRPQVNASGNDCEENVATTACQIASFGLQMNYTTTTKQLVGIRFTSVGLPKSAIIHKAYLHLIARIAATGASPTLTINGEAADSAAIFANVNANISGRSLTSASVAWNTIPSWNAANIYLSPDIGTIIQEIVNRSGWASGNDLAIIISGTTDAGNPFRDATAYDGATADAPYLEILYTQVASVTDAMGKAIGRGIMRGIGRGIM